MAIIAFIPAEKQCTDRNRVRSFYNHLIVADDIASDVRLKLTPQDTLEKAITELKNYPHDAYLLVVEKDNPRILAGVVSHNDVLSIHIQSAHHQDVQNRADGKNI